MSFSPPPPPFFFFFLPLCWNIILDCLTWKMKTPQTFDTSRATCPVAQNHVPEGVKVHKFMRLCVLFSFSQAVPLETWTWNACVMTHLLLHKLQFFRGNLYIMCLTLCAIINDTHFSDDELGKNVCLICVYVLYLYIPFLWVIQIDLFTGISQCTLLLRIQISAASSLCVS